MRIVSINAADLESDRAGQPGKMVLAAYREAGERTEAGRPSALLIDDFDTTVGEWAHSTGTVNHQQVLAQLMHLADSPTQASDETLHRIPVFITGNDLTKIYPPLRRPGRLRPLTWIPTEDERSRTVAAILADLADDGTVTKLLVACSRRPDFLFRRPANDRHRKARRRCDQGSSAQTGGRHQRPRAASPSTGWSAPQGPSRTR